MRLKLDENIPPRAAESLRELGHDVDTVVDEKIGGKSDEVVWQHAQDAGRFFITQDLDFSDLRRFAPGTHCGVLLVRLPDEEQSRLSDYLAVWFAAKETASWWQCFVVATPNKIRVLPAAAFSS
jgi:predicted nuclease of predicted toxin-antitoxin system